MTASEDGAVAVTGAWPDGSRADLRDGACQVWWARRTPPPARLLGLLDGVERDRAAAYRRAEDRERFVLGVAVTRGVLGAYLAIPAADVVLDRTCPDCGRPHGKVRLAVEGERVELSVSHSGDLVVVAFHRSAAVGVDVERVDPALDHSELYADVLADGEVAQLGELDPAARPRAFMTYWTRKEAVVKATGEGLSAPSQVVVSAPGDDPRLLSRPDRARQVTATRLHDLDPGPGYVAALAVLGDDPPVVQLDAGPWLEP